jgi:putative zinc finger protein
VAVTCLGVRELLPELAIGVLSPSERDEVEGHLRWCAGCRKEASELGQAAATFAFALAPVPVPHGLGERIVKRVSHVAGSPGTPRRARTTAASIVAAMVAVASLGWGAAMAGRADRFEDRADRAEREAAAALERFVTTIRGVVPPGQELPEDQFHLGRLTPTADGGGGGAVLQLVSPNYLDFSMVIVNGLDPDAAGRLPYRVQLLNAAGQVLRAGRIDDLDADGGAEVFHQFANKDLTNYASVQVLDSAGVVVLTGGVEGSG